jgi:thiol-disulfide isomerase/thioredoxin
MSNLIEVVSKLIRPYYFYILVFVIVVIFSVVGYYGYNTIMNQKKNKFTDVANANRRNKEAVVYFFHVDWCPHCKKALPEWSTFVSKYDGKEINGYVIKCMDIDCTKESSDVVALINQYNIDSYPTVKLIRDSTTVDFDSKITSSSLETFVNTMLNQ